MQADVNLDYTHRTIRIVVTGGPRMDCTRPWQKKTRIFQVERATIQLTNGEVQHLEVWGGLVLKSGEVSKSISDSLSWRSLERVPDWAKPFWTEAPAGVTSWSAEV